MYATVTGLHRTWFSFSNIPKASFSFECSAFVGRCIVYILVEMYIRSLERIGRGGKNSNLIDEQAIKSDE